MATIHEIPATGREDGGKGASRRLRRANKVPAIVYGAGQDPRSIQSQRDRGGISVYARNRDYHDVVKGMLKHLAQFVVKAGATPEAPQVKVFVDTAPVMEKPLAERAAQ